MTQNTLKLNTYKNIVIIKFEELLLKNYNQTTLLQKM